LKFLIGEFDFQQLFLMQKLRKGGKDGIGGIQLSEFCVFCLSALSALKGIILPTKASSEHYSAITCGTKPYFHLIFLTKQP